ncbi:MAG: ribonuclease P protein component [Woeseiaceae bacterium]|nr:ribonuclease P protein component [Woeseiaceae bacterium]
MVPSEPSEPIQPIEPGATKTQPAGKPPPRARFTRAQRLPDKASYDRVFRAARRSRDAAFTVLCRPVSEGPARLGLAIARKHCRYAVARNRLKRIIRESFRMHQAALAGLDIVVMNRPGAEKLSNRQLFDSLAAHWQRCVRHGTRRQGNADG